MEKKIGQQENALFETGSGGRRYTRERGMLEVASEFCRHPFTPEIHHWVGRVM